MCKSQKTAYNKTRSLLGHNEKADLPPTGACGPRSGTEGVIGG